MAKVEKVTLEQVATIDDILDDTFPPRGGFVKGGQLFLPCKENGELDEDAIRSQRVVINGEECLRLPVHDDDPAPATAQAAFAEGNMHACGSEEETIRQGLEDFARGPHRNLRYMIRWQARGRECMAMSSIAAPADEEEDAMQFIMHRLNIPVGTDVRFQKLTDADCERMRRNLGN